MLRLQFTLLEAVSINVTQQRGLGTNALSVRQKLQVLPSLGSFLQR